MEKVNTGELLLRIQDLEKEVATIRAYMDRNREEMWMIKGRMLSKQKNPYQIG